METRVSNWENLLVQYLEDCRNKPFKWGEHDCALFTAKWEKILINKSRFAEFFNKYKTALGSFRALKKYGKGDLVSTVDAKLDKIDKKKITRGDIVSVNTNEGIALGIYTGAKIAVVSLDGLIFLSLDDAIDCWRI